MHFEGLGGRTDARPEDVSFAINQIDVFRARQDARLANDPQPLMPKDVGDYLFRVARRGVPDEPGDMIAIERAREFVGE